MQLEQRLFDLLRIRFFLHGQSFKYIRRWHMAAVQVTFQDFSRTPESWDGIQNCSYKLRRVSPCMGADSSYAWLRSSDLPMFTVIGMAGSWAVATECAHVGMTAKQSGALSDKPLDLVVTGWHMQVKTTHVGDKRVQFFTPFRKAGVIPVT